jgi:PAS domain S-box-containing protein
MRSLRDVPIRQKLARITRLAMAAALAMVALALIVFEFVNFRSIMTQEMRSMADITGANSRAALVFLDPAAGQRILAALGSNPRITAARLYAKEGQHFATYRRADVSPDLIPDTVPADGVSLRMRSLTLVRPIRLDGERIGTIYLQSDMAALYDFLLKHGLIIIAVLGLASWVALALSSRLQAVISGPIVHLAQMVKAVTKKYDYSVRAIKSGQDELGLLTDGFNEMLARIQERDAALQNAREELEERVNLRTQELQIEIAERKRAEERLRKLSGAVEQAADNVLITNREGVIEYVNPAFEQNTGYLRDEAIGRTPRLLKSGEQSQEFYEKLWQTLLAGEVFRSVFVNRKKDGTLYCEETVITPLADSRGAITHFVSAGRDITERKQTEAALKDSEEKYRTLIEVSQDAIFINCNNHIVYMNPAAVKLFGADKPEQIIGKSPFDVVHPQYHELVRHRIQSLLSKQTPVPLLEEKYVRLDGTVIDVEVAATPLTYKNERAIQVVARDITERKRTEADLARAHAEVAGLYEQTKEDAVRWEALFTLTRLLNQSLVLDEMFEAFAQAVKSYIPYDRLGVIVPEGGQLKAAYCSSADPSLAMCQERVWRNRHETGIDWVLTSKQPRLLQDLLKEARFGDDVYMAEEGLRAILELPLIVGGDALGVFFIDSRTPGAYSTRDIERVRPLADQLALAMEHSRLFASLQRQTEALRLEVQERTRAEAEARRSQEQLRALTAHLERVREDERTRISREIHDELGQLLTSLKIDFSWVARELSGEQEALRAKVRTMGTLINTTIQSVRRIAGELRPGLLDDLGLMAAIEWQVQEFQSRMGIRMRLTAEPSELDLDRERSTAVFRILQEALTNVARHAEATHIHINLKADAERLILEVIDDGKGITPQALADRRSLGLLGMRERALLLGGEVVVSGRPGRGTTVTLVMPLKSALTTQPVG